MDTKLRDAIEYALEEFDTRECNCDGAVDAPYACYFHRIEGELRRALWHDDREKASKTSS